MMRRNSKFRTSDDDNLRGSKKFLQSFSVEGTRLTNMREIVDDEDGMMKPFSSSRAKRQTDVAEAAKKSKKKKGKKNKPFEPLATVATELLLLQPQDRLRFQPYDPASSWNVLEAMDQTRLLFTAWDASSNNEEALSIRMAHSVYQNQKSLS